MHWRYRPHKQQLLAECDGGPEVFGPEERLVVIRRLDEDGAARHDYCLSDAPPGTLPGVLARVAKAGHRVERCQQRGQSEAGLAESQVRTWSGWHHHQALSRIAAWSLVQENGRAGQWACASPRPTMATPTVMIAMPAQRVGLTDSPR